MRGQNVDLQEIVKLLTGAETILLSTHVSPDADAIGSVGALAIALKQIGKDAKVVLAERIPERLKPLAGGIPLYSDRSASEFPKAPADSADLFVVVDTASRHRISGDSDELMKTGKVSINIDHHISNGSWADYNYVDANRAASAEIVLDLMERLPRFKFTPETCNLLFAGLIEDTGCFRFSNTSANALWAAKRMVEHGAKPDEVSNVLYFSQPERVVRLRSDVCSRLELFSEGKIAFVTVDNQILTKSGALAEDTEGIIDEVRALAGVVVAVLIREIPGGWKASLRSKDQNIDVNQVAGVFGGGGHRAAAGAKLTGTVADAKSRLLTEIQKVI